MADADALGEDHMASGSVLTSIGGLCVGGRPLQPDGPPTRFLSSPPDQATGFSSAVAS
jgi:hypothetical protein